MSRPCLALRLPGGPGGRRRQGGATGQAEHHGALEGRPIMLEPGRLVVPGSLHGAGDRRVRARHVLGTGPLAGWLRDETRLRIPSLPLTPCARRPASASSFVTRSDEHPLLGVCFLRGITGENVLTVPAQWLARSRGSGAGESLLAPAPAAFPQDTGPGRQLSGSSCRQLDPSRDSQRGRRRQLPSSGWGDRCGGCTLSSATHRLSSSPSGRGLRPRLVPGLGVGKKP